MTRRSILPSDRGAVRGLVLAAALLLGACTDGPDPAAGLDAIAWPPTWELVHRASEDDPSCGERSCPTEVRYLTTGDAPEATCANAADALEVSEPEGPGCSLVDCRSGMLVTVNVSGERQRVSDVSGPDQIAAPSGGSAVALRARTGC